jgi:polyhydroxybutyrate depolymerase
MKRKYINTGDGILIVYIPCFGGGIKNMYQKKKGERNMRKKIIGIFVCMLLITTCVIPISGTLIESKKKNSSVSPGDYFHFMVFDKRPRSYRIHVPPSYDGSNPVPLVLVLHGFPGTAKEMLSVGMNAKADEEGFITVYPNGHTDLRDFNEVRWGLWCLIHYHYWGFCFNMWAFDNVDDVSFIRTMIETLQTSLNINSSRIYITGLSNGACMSYRLGAELSDIVAAIAPIAGTIGGIWTGHPLYIIPEPEHPLPVIVFHGMNDSAIPYDGDPNWTISVNDSVTFWVEHNQCDPNPQINISESGNIIKRTYANGSLGTEVVLYTVVDGVHGWFGAPAGIYEYPCEISATDLIWEFFESHPKQ